MKRSILITITLCLCLTVVKAQDAKSILVDVIRAMGGMDTWKDIRQIQMTHVGHKHWMEQSENPNGPFITSYQVVDETRGVWETMLHRKESTRQFQSAGASETMLVLNEDKGLLKFGDRSFPMPASYRTSYDEWLRYAPERLIFEALNHPLKQEKDAVVEGTPHHVISYQKEGLNHKLFINTNTHLLYQAEIESFLPQDVFNYPWGKFKTTIIYSLQWLYPGEIRYPAQWSIYKLGKLYQSSTITSISFQSELDSDLFEIPENIPALPPAQPVEETTLPIDQITKVADNMYTIPGSWYVGHIIQEDGILIIESPISSGYNAQHLDYLKKQYPDKPIKAVFSTSDAWPHIGGIREFAARKIPIYTHRLNEEIIRKVLDADHSPLPDLYEEARQKPRFKLVDKPVLLDDTETPVQVIPVNGEGGERMIMLYMPKQKILYASDLVQYIARNKSFFSPQYLTEVKAAIDRHGLEVETVFAFHTSPIAYSEILAFLEKL